MRHHSITRNQPLHVVALLLIVVAAAPLPALAASPMPQSAPPSPSAPAPASLDQILKDVSTYDGGIESSAMWKLRDYVRARRDDPAGRAECEAKLLQFLGSRATPEAKMAACRHLRAIAGDSAIPALQALLTDERSTDMALYVLQQVPGAKADEALLLALSRTSRTTKAAVIAALGERRVAGAVPTLAPLLRQPDLAGPSALALGAIGDDPAAGALLAAWPGATAALKGDVAGALMKCAERALAGRNAAAALRIYDTLLADGTLPFPIRAAATMGRVSASGANAPAVLAEILGGPDAGLHEAVIARIADVIAPDAIGPLCAVLPRLPEATRVPLLAALARYPRERVLPAVLESARTGTGAVRIAALRALETTGDASVVPFLLETAAGTRGAEQAAARTALGALRGSDVDEALAAGLAGKPPDAIAIELLLAVAERRVFPAKPAVAALVASTSPRIRLQALKSLRTVGTPSDIPAVIDALLAASGDQERSESEATVSALALKTGNVDRRSREVRARLAAAKTSDVRVRLLGLLPLIGDAPALPILRAALDDRDADVHDAAIRGLTAWPTADARDDVFRLARDERNETHRLLAIRGLVRLVSLERYRNREAAVADLRLAAGFAWRPEEQKLILGALGQFPCPEALAMASGFLGEPAVKAEAQAAVDKISAGLK